MTTSNGVKLNPKAIALSSGIISAALAFVCAILIGFWPEATMGFFGWAVHIDLSSFVGLREVTWANFFGGIIVMFLVSYILGWFFALIYNKFIGKEISE